MVAGKLLDCGRADDADAAAAARNPDTDAGGGLIVENFSGGNLEDDEPSGLA